ncbi:MAG: signal peptidase I [Clostridia bacterium]|nr:signal peptidase I [Clostridia bacterium]
MNSLKPMLKIIRFFASVVIIGMVALIMVQRFSNNKISLAGYRVFTVITESMEPVYNVGDVLLVKYENPSNSTSYMVGDDIAYQGEVDDFAGKIITHRLQKIGQENGERIYITKGISSKVESEDPPIKGNQIYGKVITKLYIMSFLSGIINNNYGMYFLIVLPLAFIIFMEVKGYKKDKEEMLKEDKEEFDDDYEDEYDDDYKYDDYNDYDDYDDYDYYEEKKYNSGQYKNNNRNRTRREDDVRRYNQDRYDNYDNRRYNQNKYNDYEDRKYIKRRDENNYEERRYMNKGYETKKYDNRKMSKRYNDYDEYNDYDDYDE